MPSQWSFGDDLPLGDLSKPGQLRCYHCGAAAPAGVPSSYARCNVCHYHLHTCQNCLFYNGVGCLILEPHIWSDGAVMGQFCPSFAWREEEEEGP